MEWATGVGKVTSANEYHQENDESSSMSFQTHVMTKIAQNCDPTSPDARIELLREGCTWVRPGGTVFGLVEARGSVCDHKCCVQSSDSMGHRVATLPPGKRTIPFGMP